MKKLVFIFSVILVLTACGDNEQLPTTDEADQASEVETPYETIDLNAVMELVDDGYTVVDVREIDEYDAGHIPNAINAPLSTLENDDFTPLESNEKYLVICQSGNRSITASNILYDAGFDIVNVSEGMSTWTGDVEQ